MEICVPGHAHSIFHIFMLRKKLPFSMRRTARRIFRARTGRADNPSAGVPLPAARGSAPAQVVRTTPRGSFPELPQFPLPFSGNLRYNSFRIGRHPPETHRGG